MKEDKSLKIRGNVVDVINRRIYGAEVILQGKYIQEIRPTGQKEETYLLPGFIDAHIHIESSMVTPAAFARSAVKQGTIGVVADPHEITNVMGTAGIDYMLNDAKGLSFYTWIGLPSCVPATAMETAGACIDAAETARLLQRDDIHFLAEMMNFPGVCQDDPEVLAKLRAAQKAGKPIDGHFPNASWESLKKYIQAGISTDHEATTLEEGRQKCELGMHILIREGSAARDFEALHPLLKEYPNQIMFCTDDAHPGFLQAGHINKMVRRALQLGYDLYDVLRAASYNTIRHYAIPAGLLQEKDPADFIQVNNLEELSIMATYLRGECVYDGKQSLLPWNRPCHCNNFHTKPITLEKLQVKAKGKQMRVIVCEDGALTTHEEIVPVRTADGFVESDTRHDILKLVVVNRYQTAPPSIAFIKGCKLKLGAIAQSISHDSHNIIAVGATDFELMQAINAVIQAKGGIAVSFLDEVSLLPLPIAGLMSDAPLEETCHRYQQIEKKIKQLGTPMDSLQMTLSFMALLVIPKLKVSDKALFDGETFQSTSLFL